MKRDSTKRILREMLTENTGTHFLDSGGAYGRNWERNQKRNFDTEPEATLRFNKYTEDGPADLEITLNLYHWLADRLTYDSRLNSRWTRFANAQCRESKGWLELESLWVESIGGETPLTDSAINTYNGEDLLSQIIQYLPFRLDGCDYVLLQIHGGCDARGGYTAPKVFRTYEDDYSLYDNARCTVYCDGPEVDTAPTLPGAEWPEQDTRPHHWYTDNAGYTFENDESDADLKDARVDSETGKGYCPICDAELHASAY